MDDMIKILEKICDNIDEIKEYIAKFNDKNIKKNEAEKLNKIIEDKTINDYTKIVLKDLNSRISILEEESQIYSKNI